MNVAVQVPFSGLSVCFTSMKAYVMTTGTAFGLLTLVHIWRVVAEEPHLAKDPWFLLITFAGAALCGWAWRVLRVSSRS
jgi:hypothetical protein